ncbi:GntR family transcriptional regulator [Ulvibacterium sp.]|uniref:GntR family transcriptional regulator n=1 Tax=Ulvibacterium sp. TaxID=2665914 RepID=UPI003BAAD9C8
MEKTLPQYKKLHLTLKQGILSGAISKGSLLPSENELSAKYNITRATVRQGLQELVREGFIEKRMGIGSVVVNDRKTLGLLTFKGFSEVLESSALSSTTQNLKMGEIGVWPSPFFYELTPSEKEEGCFFLERLRSVEGHPVMLEFTYIPQKGVPKLVETMGKGSLFATLQQAYKIEILKVLQDVRAIHAPKTILKRLNLAPNTPVLHIHRKYLTTKSDFHIYSSLYCNTEKYAISNFFN